MSKHLRMALLVALGVVCLVSSAFAVVPDPTFSTMGLYMAYGPSGFITYTVVVHDQFNAPINNASVVLDYGVNAPLYCANQAPGITKTGNTLSGNTDVTGTIVFPLRMAKCVNAGQIKVIASGTQLGFLLRASSVDIDGNFLVNVLDLGAWAAFQATTDPCGDYDGTGTENVLDLGIWAAGQAAGGCP